MLTYYKEIDRVMKIVVILIFVAISLFARMEDWNLTNKSFEKVKILDSKVLYFDKIVGEKFFGISALEYDKKKKILYMLNDRSRLFRFKIDIKNGKINSLKPIGACRLRNKKGKYFFLYQSDSEGLVKRKNRFFISFEGRHPRVTSFDMKCRQRGRVRLPKILRKSYYYQGKNKALESLVYTNSFGLITAPEKRLKKTPKYYHTLFNRYGKICRFKKRDDKLCLVDLEGDGKGNLIALFRKLDMKHLGFITKVKRIDIQNIKRGICKVEDIFSLESAKGDMTDNFEGIVRVGKNLYLMVSDDNDRFFQNTLLVLFEVV